jgi:hypothetical protein
MRITTLRLIPGMCLLLVCLAQCSRPLPANLWAPVYSGVFDGVQNSPDSYLHAQGYSTEQRAAENDFYAAKSGADQIFEARGKGEDIQYWRIDGAWRVQLLTVTARTSDTRWGGLIGKSFAEIVEHLGAATMQTAEELKYEGQDFFVEINGKNGVAVKVDVGRQL